jgi:hypothetical protein
MSILRRLVAQDSNYENQWLKVDHGSRYIVNDVNECQFLFGPNSELNNSAQVLKIAAQLNTNTLDKIRFTGYLYNPKTGAIDSSSSVIFNIYSVTDIASPRWDDVFVTSVTGVQQSNSYYFAEVSISSFVGLSLDGDTTLMIEAVATRLGITYRDRIYVNHLGVYESVVRLRQDVDFLNITKKDL